MKKGMSAIERISPVATRAVRGDVLSWSEALVEAKAADAASGERQREIHVLHDDDGDLLHRMLNALQPGSYIQPHRHLKPPKAESLVLLRGSIGFVPFFDDGEPDEAHMVLLGRGAALGLDVRAGVWHTFFALEPNSVVFEVKAGPYDPSSDKDFAPWAPREGDAEAAPYLARLEARLRRVATRSSSRP